MLQVLITIQLKEALFV